MPSDMVDPRALAFALQQIDDGFLFEEFANRFLSQVIGYQFLPAGGIKDRAIDGLSHIFERKGFSRWLYQSSIQKDARSKVFQTGTALSKNDISYDLLHYVTNQQVKEKDVLVGDFFERFQKPLQILDLGWFQVNANHSEGARGVFHLFVSEHLHQYQQPGAGYVVSDLVSDPRLFVFLRQQFDSSAGADLKNVLADTLILYALEGTDPDAGVFKNKSEIVEDISKRISFEPRLLTDSLDERLAALSTKPRRIHHHPKDDNYCLPYETRTAIQTRNLADAALQAAFRDHSTAVLTKYLSGIPVADGIGLIEDALHRLFYQQGLEFSAFILKGENREAIEKNLNDIIGLVVEQKGIAPGKKARVTSALHIAMRDMVYNGTPEQQEFLSRLSHTYMMLFLLKVDPKITTYFKRLASELRIYVDNSIIVPALSEYFLAPENRRHWNLLKSARTAGVQLLIEERILGELTHHFRMIRSIYDEKYRTTERTFLGDELLTLYIDEIMIRAYFYSKIKGQVSTFDQFLDKFVDPRVPPRANEQLMTWLQEEFGIRFVEVTGVVEKSDYDALYSRLKDMKSHDEKAATDAQLALTIYQERQRNGERSDSGMFGYRTWWLSKDSSTMRAIRDVFPDRFETSCYIRPDFLHNYISLAPTTQEVRDAYRTIFPTLVGVNISYHVPGDITALVQSWVKEHSEKNSGRVLAVLRDLTERLKSEPGFRTRGAVKHFLDEQRAGLEGGAP
jgi:hypothetical protein